MQKDKEEIWKEYPLEIEMRSKLRLEFSNHGRIRTFHVHDKEGKVIKGGLREGYPIYNTTFFKERPKKVQEKLKEFKDKMNLVLQEIKELSKIEDLPEKIIEDRLSILKVRKGKLMEERKAYTKKADKKLKIYFHILVHRAVAELFLEKGEDSEKVIHKDFNKLNNHVDNLQWVTKKEALARYKDAPNNILWKRKQKFLGVKTPKTFTYAKLTETDVLYIKEKLHQGKTLKSLALRFGVSDMQIHRIKTGENWSRIKTVSELRQEKV